MDLPSFFRLDGRTAFISAARGHLGTAMTRALAKAGGQWDEARLSDWLISPQSFASGTKMVFPGFARAQDRADVIAYLKTLN